MNNAFGRGLLNGWQLSGISSLASGIPLPTELHRRRRPAAPRRPPTSAPPTWSVRATAAATASRRSTPAIRASSGRNVGEKLLDINCIAVPAFGKQRRPRAALQHAHADADEPRPDAVQELRDPGRSEAAVPRRVLQHLQPGVRQHASIGSDINLTLDTTCRVRVPGVPNGAGGTVRRLRPDRRASTTRRRPSTTSGRST